MNIPNSLTTLRVALVPLLVLLFFSQHPSASLAAACTFILAAITDVRPGACRPGCAQLQALTAQLCRH